MTMAQYFVASHNIPHGNRRDWWGWGETRSFEDSFLSTSNLLSFNQQSIYTHTPSIKTRQI